jgi:chromosome segregation ATPase
MSKKSIIYTCIAIVILLAIGGAIGASVVFISSENEKDDLLEQLTNLNAELLQTLTSHEDLKLEYAELDAIVKPLQALNDKLKADYDGLKDEQSQQNTEYLNLQAEFRKLEVANDALEKRIKSLEKRYDCERGIWP